MGELGDARKKHDRTLPANFQDENSRKLPQFRRKAFTVSSLCPHLIRTLRISRSQNFRFESRMMNLRMVGRAKQSGKDHPWKGDTIKRRQGETVRWDIRD